MQDMKRSDVIMQNAGLAFLEEFLENEELGSASEEKQVCWSMVQGRLF